MSPVTVFSLMKLETWAPRSLQSQKEEKTETMGGKKDPTVSWDSQKRDTSEDIGVDLRGRTESSKFSYTEASILTATAILPRTCSGIFLYTSKDPPVETKIGVTAVQSLAPHTALSFVLGS